MWQLIQIIITNANGVARLWIREFEWLDEIRLLARLFTNAGALVIVAYSSDGARMTFGDAL